MKELGPIRTGLLCCLGSLGAGILLTELLGLPEYHTALFVAAPSSPPNRVTRLLNVARP